MCAVTDLMCSDHLYPRVRRMRDLTTAVFPILYPSPVFLCFITHTSAIELHTTISFHCYTKYTTHIPHIPHIKAKRPMFPFTLLFLPCILFGCALRNTRLSKLRALAFHSIGQWNRGFTLHGFMSPSG